jgi:hypothetical protein
VYDLRHFRRKKTRPVDDMKSTIVERRCFFHENFTAYGSGCNGWPEFVEVSGIPCHAWLKPLWRTFYSALQQDFNTLLHGFLRLATDNRVIVVGNRVWNDGKWKLGHAGHPGHGLSRLYEPVRNDRCGCDAGFLG